MRMINSIRWDEKDMKFKMNEKDKKDIRYKWMRNILCYFIPYRFDKTAGQHISMSPLT